MEKNAHFVLKICTNRFRDYIINKRIVIDKILIASIIRRIDINNINLPCMGITKGCKGFEVITFYKNMVWSLSIIAEDGTFRHFNKHRLLVDHSLFSILRLVFPNQTILLLRTKQFD